MSSSYRFKDQGYFLWILLFLWHQPVTYCQRGYFPDLRDLSALKPITSSSTCGAQAMVYCQSFRSNSSLRTCFVSTCEFACCSSCGSSKPVPTDLAQNSVNQRVLQDGEPRNGSSVNSYRFQGNSYLQPLRVPSVDYVRTGFTLSVWIKQRAGNRGTIISKDQLSAPHYPNIFQLIIQDYDLTFRYVPIGGNSSLTVTYNLIQSQSEKLCPDEWHFITVSIIDKALSYYIDGQLMTANSVTLSGSLNGPGGSVRIGQSYAGSDQYEGLMQDIQMYTQALTNREVIEAFTGVLPPEYVASQCRCPPTHPKIYPGGPTSAPSRCLRNVEGSLDDAVSRLADTAHPVELATDGDTLGFWLSELTENATIDIELSYSRLQVFSIVLTFYGPKPGAILIERSTDRGKTFQPWQYFAEDCRASFQLENNGQLSEPDVVNCIQYRNPLLANGETITFQTEYQPPPGSNIPVRPFGPGCDNLYCSEKLLQFMKATNVRFHFYNHTLVTNAQHRYYGLDRILVAGRCECFGHALTYRNVEGTGGQLGRCVCDCHPSTNTEGENCYRCQPLYNNKPFQRGNIVNAFPCIKCECNEHADSCVYNQTLDSHPSSRTLGGGGVCVNCQHNTTGRFCELCNERYYRESGKNLTDKDVCSPCGCEGPGVQSGKLDCVKDDSNSSVLAGQCDCKVNTMGRQCNMCKDGFYGLQASHEAGCIPFPTNSTFPPTTTEGTSPTSSTFRPTTTEGTIFSTPTASPMPYEKSTLPTSSTFRPTTEGTIPTSSAFRPTTTEGTTSPMPCEEGTRKHLF
ncbi:usherin-like isoform X1 [Acropora muricata]|uniref:usherin-like isoform X1 n=1 Tax=Acropora muricata TaxID=159855 RepID=UPI0034E49608